jgi:alpha-glucoside transport system substrate-binding protein
MAYLVGEQGQTVWPLLGSAFSANKKLLANPKVYTDPVSRKIAETLTGAATLCFDASDLMPAKMSDAFSRAVLEYIADPGRLDGLLGSLERVRAGIQPEDRHNVPCGG